MKIRHIAFLGITASTFLALTINGCSASDTTTKPKPKSDGGSAGSTGAGGAPTGGSGTVIVMNPTTGGGDMAGAGGSGLGDCTTPMVTAKASVAADVLTDLEGDAPGAIINVLPGGGWYSYQDAETGTTFIPAPGAFMVEAGGLGMGGMGTGSAVHVAGTGFMGPPSATNWGAGVGFSLGGGTPGGLVSGSGMTTTPTDLSAYTGISFYAKSAAGSNVQVQIPTPDTDPNYCTCAALNLCYTTHRAIIMALGTDWKAYTVKWTELAQPDYGGKVAFDPANVLVINFASDGPVPMFDYWIDQVTLTK